MRRLLTLVALLVIAPSVRAQTTASQRNDEAAPTFHASVNIVLVDAAVLSKKTHRPISPLRYQDFVVYEDGVQQRLVYFSQDQLPLSVVLLFDLTDSVRPVLKSLADGALASLQHLKPQDEVAVMVYAASATLLQDFTTDRALAAAAIKKASKMKSDEAAFFNEGLYQAATRASYATNPNTRRVIIWLTDNVPNIPSDDIRRRYARSLAHSDLHTEKQALDSLFKTGAMVCALVQQSEMSERETMSRTAHWGQFILDRNQFPPGDVYRYAEQTGGEVAESNSRRMPEKLAAMIDSIRARYTLGYKPAPDESGRFRELRVRLAPDAERRVGRANVVAKRGYWR
jgi:VWFA-related protein